MENDKLIGFLKQHDLKIQQVEDYRKAFKHRSYLQVDKNSEKNERLEFLGDAVLELIITDYLYNTYDIQEGRLSQIRAKTVSEEPLSEIAESLNIGELLYLGKGEELNGGRKKPSILSDTLEALIGSIYHIEGFQRAYDFIIPFLKQIVGDVVNNKDFLNPKTKLQELSQKLFKKLPEYSLVKEEQVDGIKIYTLEVVIGNQYFGPVKSYSKKLAEQELAKKALEVIEDV